MMILKERALLVTELTSNTPLVSSIIPEMIGFANDKSIFKSFNGMYNKYENISKILHSFPTRRSSEIGRASCRERVYVSFLPDFGVYSEGLYF